ncbi:hypothetical protein QMK19_06330 [Streptomyces sp. H10-C2]|uniref:hypothetical protein n=1 Tax=unclassified Streptomyces TaxID=2593676 RepID=UPI0024BA1528|nr:MULTISPECIES: hypothetical protein [unclassified Streptomyces]MDJ0340060.1 hypothetical protein [Streptomyces sp. PH10-H1]MDJ0369303.1 hypothetical protein [Streptomyces sp. H10-C2]
MQRQVIEDLLTALVRERLERREIADLLGGSLFRHGYTVICAQLPVHWRRPVNPYGG